MENDAAVRTGKKSPFGRYNQGPHRVVGQAGIDGLSGRPVVLRTIDAVTVRPGEKGAVRSQRKRQHVMIG